MKILTCRSCGKLFLQRLQDSYCYCRICSVSYQKKKKQKQIKAENLKWEEQQKRSRALFEEEVRKFKTKTINCIEPAEKTLYVIGNGFDLMHRVSASYYSFRDSLGKNNRLRNVLEFALTPNDIWADFEDSLGRMNLDLIGDSDIVDLWVDSFKVYDEDSGAAEFYAAVEAVAGPIETIASDLLPAFRRWVSKLSVGTEDRPLEKLICSEGKCLCFNYTEFPEVLYSLKNVCYIHGCRKNQNDKLILGHRPGMNGDFQGKGQKPHSYHQAGIKLIRDNAFDLIDQYDEELTKDSQEIIANHKAFFESLTDIDQIVVIGHSFSLVDWDYFSEVKRVAPNAKWYFGIFGLTDLQNLKEMVQELSIEEYSVFRTDMIKTAPSSKADEETKPKIKNTPKPRVFKDGDTTVTINNTYILRIDSEPEIVLPESVKKIVFLGNHFLILLNDLDSSIVLFNKQDHSWRFTARLEGFEHSGLINRRLNYIFADGDRLTFVYNSRVRAYDLVSGTMVYNKQIRDAKDRNYQGIDVTKEFLY